MKQRQSDKHFLLFLTLSCAIVFIAAQEAFAHKTLKLDNWSTYGLGPEPNGYLVDAVHDESKFNLGTVGRIKSSLPVQPKCVQGIFADFSPYDYRGKNLKFTAWIKAEKVTGKAQLWTAADNDEKFVGGVMSSALTGSSPWRKESITFKVPADVDRLRVGFMLAGGGTALFGAPAVEIVGDNAKPSKCDAESMARLAHIYKLSPAPKNLEFDDTRATFENQANSVENWAVHNDSGFEVRLLPSEKFKDKPTVQFSSKNAAPNGFASIYQTFDSEPYRGKRVEFSAFVKTHDVDDWDGLFMQIDGNRLMLAFDAMEDRPIKGTTDWKRYSCILDVPKNSEQIKIGFLHSHLGTAWIGQGAFAVVSRDVPVTVAKPQTAKLPAHKLSAHPDLEFK